MKVKTSELTGAALDWAVAKCNGKTLHYFVDDPFKKDPWLTVDGIADQPLHSHTPSSDWAQGGPIIEREEITVCWQGATWVGSKFNVRVTDEYEFQQTGTTPLIAAMRCFVASKLGDEVDVPDELAKGETK